MTKIPLGSVGPRSVCSFHEIVHRGLESTFERFGRAFFLSSIELAPCAVVENYSRAGTAAV